MGGQAGVRTLREDIEEHAHPILHELAVMAIMGRRADTLERPAIEANTLESKFGKRGDRALSAPGMAIRPGFDCCGGSEAARGALGVLGCPLEGFLLDHAAEIGMANAGNDQADRALRPTLEFGRESCRERVCLYVYIAVDAA